MPSRCVNSCTGCGESVSLSASEQDNDGSKKFCKPFKCFFCGGVIGYSAPYVRMPHPLGAMNKNQNQPRFLYLHADGASCVGKPVPTDTNAACAGDCGNASPAHALYDMVGVGKEAHYFCDGCKYKRRAGVLAGAQEHMERERIKRENTVCCSTGPP